jgi:hypothetical protein
VCDVAPGFFFNVACALPTQSAPCHTDHSLPAASCSLDHPERARR